MRGQAEVRVYSMDFGANLGGVIEYVGSVGK